MRPRVSARWRRRTAMHPAPRSWRRGTNRLCPPPQHSALPCSGRWRAAALGPVRQPGGQALQPHLSACSQSNTFRGKRSDFRLGLGVRTGWTSLSLAAFWAAGHPPCKLIFCPRGSPLRGLQRRRFAYWYAWVKFGKSCIFCVVWEDCKRFGTCHFGIWIILS